MKMAGARKGRTSRGGRWLASALSVALCCSLVPIQSYGEEPISVSEQEKAVEHPEAGVQVDEAETGIEAGPAPDSEPPANEGMVEAGVEEATPATEEDDGIDQNGFGDEGELSGDSTEDELAVDEDQESEAVILSASEEAGVRIQSFSDGVPISVGSSYSGNLTRGSNAMYRFSLTTSGEVVVSMTAKFNCSLALYDAGGNRVWGGQNWYVNTVTGRCDISENVQLTSGTYLFNVSNNSDSGDYSFKLGFTSANESFREVQGGSDNSIETANVISLDAAYKGQIAVNDAKDFYKVALGSSGRVFLSATAWIRRMNLYIYNSAGQEMWRNYCYSNSTTGRADVSEVIDLTKGTYYFCVADSETGRYSFKLGFSSASESFIEVSGGSNNSIGKAGKASFNKLYKGQIAANDDKDFYRYDLPAGQNVTLSSTSRMKSATYLLYDANGNEIWRGHFYANSTTGRADISEGLGYLAKGVYYLCIEQYGSSTGNYSFSLDAPNVPSGGSSNTLTAPTIKFNGAWSPRGIKIGWGKVNGAGGYYLMRSTSANGSYTKVGSTTSATSFADTSAAPGKVYYYKVQAWRMIGSAKIGGPLSQAYRVKVPPAAVGITSAIVTSPKGMKVTWAKSTGVSGYYLMRSTSKDGTYSKVGSTTTATSFTDTSAVSGKTYFYKVRPWCWDGSTRVAGPFSAAFKAVASKPSAPTISSTKPAIKVAWSSVAGADGYYLLRSSTANGTYSKVGSTSATNFADEGITKGKTYYYKVQAWHWEGSLRKTLSYSPYRRVVA